MRRFSRWFGSVAVVVAFCAAQSVWSADNFTRQDIIFKSSGLNLVGWLYVPNGLKSGEKRPAIVMAHGWSAVKEMYLDAFAAKFANRGFVVTVIDYRNFGDSQAIEAFGRAREPKQLVIIPGGHFDA